MSQGKKRFYAVVRGRTPGIYTLWFGPGGAEEQIRGFTGALYRGFTTMPEAQDFMLYPRYTPASKPTARHHEETEESTRDVQNRPIHIYTDGGCIENPGPGGYGVVIIEEDKRSELSGGYRLTTNNRMELMACIQALRALKQRSNAVLFTDSQYVANAIRKGWALKWRSRNWMRDKTHRAVNSDLWAELLGLIERHDMVFCWVRGHAGNPENERCDVLAKKAARGTDLAPDPGFEDVMKRITESRLF
ncbi:MAG: ribonuclease HI [Desulfomonilia bacterium]